MLPIDQSLATANLCVALLALMVAVVLIASVGGLLWLWCRLQRMLRSTSDAMTLSGTCLASSVPLKIQRLSEAAVLPRYATAGSACFDLQAIDVPAEGILVENDRPAVFRTGLAVEIPDGFVMLIYSRSGHGFKHDVRLSNSTGVIDADYRGELHVKLAADGAAFRVHNGDRIAQALLLPIPEVQLVEVDALSSTGRGTGGYGSTGR